MGRREEMKKAIENNKKSQQLVAKLPKSPPWQRLPDKAAVVKKENPRSAAARDARAKQRGRLPEGAKFEAAWRGGNWHGMLNIYDKDGQFVVGFGGTRDGLFRSAEEYDIMFWEWLANPSVPEQHLKANLEWPVSQPPEPMPPEMKNVTQAPASGGRQ